MLDVHAIEEQLRLLRGNAGDGEDKAGRYADVRMAVLNLVVVTFQQRLAEEAAQTLALLASHHPSRAVIIFAEPQAKESRLEADLAAHCQWSPGGTKHVCSEQVALRAGGAVVEHLSSLIIPLLISELPIVVWWQGNPDPGAPLFHQLCDLGDALVVDSGDFATPAATLPGVLEATQRAARECALVDLAWTRLYPWRALLAQGFDRGVRSGEVRDITIENGGDTPSAEALLCAGWLRGQLGTPLPLLLRGGFGEPGLHAVRIRALRGRRRMEFSIERRGAAIYAEGGGASRAAPRAPLVQATGTQTLAAALMQRGRDLVYERALAHLGNG